MSEKTEESKMLTGMPLGMEDVLERLIGKEVIYRPVFTNYVRRGVVVSYEVLARPSESCGSGQVLLNLKGNVAVFLDEVHISLFSGRASQEPEEKKKSPRERAPMRIANCPNCGAFINICSEFNDPDGLPVNGFLAEEPMRFKCTRCKAPFYHRIIGYGVTRSSFEECLEEGCQDD